MNTLELKDKKEQLKKRAEELISGAEKEVRKLNEGEQNELNTILNQVSEIDEEIRKIEQDNLKGNKTMEKFSLLKAINDVANNRQLDERAQEVVNAGIAEMRKAGQNYSGQIVLPVEERSDIQATVATAGQENVAEDKLGILEPLRANLVLAQAGASYMTGLVGNVSIPAYSGSNVLWADENGDAADGAGITYDNLFDLMVARQPIDAVFALEGDSEDYAEKKLDEVPEAGWTPATTNKTGKVVITSLELNAPNGDNATFTCNFEGVGALKKVAAE